MKKQKANITAFVMLGERKISVLCEIEHTVEGFLHGKKLPNGFHVEVTALNHEFTDSEAEKLHLVKMSGPTRKTNPVYILSENFMPGHIVSFTETLTRASVWLSMKHEEVLFEQVSAPSSN